MAYINKVAILGLLVVPGDFAYYFSVMSLKTVFFCLFVLFCFCLLFCRHDGFPLIFSPVSPNTYLTKKCD